MLDLSIKHTCIILLLLFLNFLHIHNKTLAYGGKGIYFRLLEHVLLILVGVKFVILEVNTVINDPSRVSSLFNLPLFKLLVSISILLMIIIIYELISLLFVCYQIIVTLILKILMKSLHASVTTFRTISDLLDVAIQIDIH